jgi:predicted nucleic acid-binding protein
LILVDTSVWIDHFRIAVAPLEQLIRTEQAMCHPFIRGELAVGRLRNWLEVAGALLALPQAKTASEGELLALIVNERLAATGLGFVDVHLLASCRATPGAKLWSRDKRLAGYADRMSLSWAEV